jgi:hypothetical protein
MLLSSDGRKGELCEGLSDADDGFELADRDGDRRAGVSFEFAGVDLFSDGDEVGGELFCSFGGEARCAASINVTFN